MPFSDDKPFGNKDQLSDSDGSRLSESMTCSSSDSESPRESFTSSSSSESESPRESFTSNSSSKHTSPVSSPPRTTTLDDIMSTTRDFSNLLLAHEIVANQNFRLATVDPPKNSLQAKVKLIVHQAFWDHLESELKKDPPVYEHVIKLFDEIKEILLSFLTPGTNRLRTQICEVLDVDLIRQQAEHNAVDIPKLGGYIINIMSKLCAPVRDEDVKKLQVTGDLVQMLRDVFHVLDLMRMDMVNYTIHSIRPHLQRQLAEYERVKFQEVLERSPDALNQTTKWIEQGLKSAVEEKSQEGSSGANGVSVDNLSPTLVLNSGFVKLLQIDYDGVVPETVLTDDLRIVDLKNKLYLVKLVACICLIIQNAMGSLCTYGFIEKVREISAILLQGLNKDSNVKETLAALSTKVSLEMNKSLTERGLAALGTETTSNMEGQICRLTEKNHPIYSLIEKRIEEYLTAFLCLPYPCKNAPVLPGGLTPVRLEMEFIGFHYSNIVNFNKQVYGPFYANIFRKLLFSQPQEEKVEAKS